MTQPQGRQRKSAQKQCTCPDLGADNWKTPHDDACPQNLMARLRDSVERPAASRVRQVGQQQ